MSYDLNVYLKFENMPKPKAWREAILQAGFALELDSDFDIKTFSGFLPCIFNKQECGFEIYFSTLDPKSTRDLGVPNELNFDVYFRTLNGAQELVAARIAAGVLASLSKGTLTDPQTGETIDASTAIVWARNHTEETPSVNKRTANSIFKRLKFWSK